MANLLGIEIGGTKLQLGLDRGDGTITRLIRRDVDPSKNADGIRLQILDAFRFLDTEVSAVGIGFGGPVDTDRGEVVKSHQIDGWDSFPLVEWIRNELSVLNVALSNDADAAALGEATFGAGRGLSPILYVNSGSGIGGGLIIEGKIYRGSGLGAIEIGHMLLRGPVADGMVSGSQTLEQLASGWAIGEEGRKLARRCKKSEEFGRTHWLTGLWGEPGSLIRLCEGDPERVDARMVAESARLGNFEGQTVLRSAIIPMATALAHAVTLLAPKRVILGGGVALMGDDLWLDPIRELVEKRVFPPFLGTFDMRTAELGEDVVVHGALALARDLIVTAQ